MTVGLALECTHRSRDFEPSLRSVRFAQGHWAEASVGTRVAILRRFRHAVAANAKSLAGVVQKVRVHSSLAEILSSEILPLLEACKFAENNAVQLLRPVRLRRKGRPFWLAGTDLELRREPFGIVLVIAPGNYPLFLSGVQAIQALLAGNAVVLKPAPGTSLVAHRFGELLVEAGLNAHLLHVIDEDPDSAHRAIESGVDKIILTGSESTGQNVLRRASESFVPVTCELSGCDAMIVLPGADLDLAATALRFGLRLNASQTCMRPHRVFVHSEAATEFKQRAVDATRDVRIPITTSAISRLNDLLDHCPGWGVTQIAGDVFEGNVVSPHIFENGDSTSEIWQSDIFAPVLVFRSFQTENDLIQSFNACRYGLGACIFGPAEHARQLSGSLNTGFVLINDVIVPTADPRFPFSGRKRSGFGMTRGTDGLLELTRVKAISIRRTGYQHFQDEKHVDESLFAGVIAAAHGGTLLMKAKGAIQAIRAVRGRMQLNEKVS